jgi:putative membrane protein
MAADPAQRAAVAPLRVRSASLMWSLAGVGVVLQICYPLSSGAVRDRLTIAIVIALSAACIAHAALTCGRRVATAVLLTTAGGGFLVEAVGAYAGVPFGRYRYTDSLGPHLLGVPVVIALAWTMLAWPAVVGARRLVTGRAARVLVGGWALCAADLFLDPQMVAAGYWRWADPTPHLPGVATVALSNLAGWLVVSIVFSATLNRLLGPGPQPADDRLAVGLYVWLWAGWTVALLVFLGLPAAALWGAFGMGVVAVPLAARLRR